MESMQQKRRKAQKDATQKYVSQKEKEKGDQEGVECGTQSERKEERERERVCVCVYMCVCVCEGEKGSPVSFACLVLLITFSWLRVRVRVFGAGKQPLFVEGQQR